MIEKIIELSIRNRFLVISRRGGANSRRYLRDPQYAGRCDSRLERKPSHCLHRLDGTESEGN